MTHHDVMQWLNEIRLLQEQLAQTSQERDQAYEQLTRWHQSYQTEASQRRADVERLQRTIERLVAENQRLKQRLIRVKPSIPNPAQSETTMAVNQGHPSPVDTLSQLATIESLQQQLTEAIALRDRLSQSLRQEQHDHAQTRQTLMGALGDTIEQLERERKRHTSASTPSSDSPQTPWLGPPPKQLAPTPTSSDSDNA